MIKNLLFVFILSYSFNMNAQSLNWLTDVNAAIEISNKENKPLLLLFADKNASNTLLYSQVLNTLDFALWSRDNVVIVKIDLTQEDGNEYIDRNLNLKKAFGVDVNPSICFARASSRKGKINYQLIGKMAYKQGGVKSWLSDVKVLLTETSE
ncbi:thioredoxin domain-containing protein [Flavobacterium tiangeerense]|uniref:thioredoxin family protein n=1 Tax=Flavobacterium tiangeerense TaxID=459471 RepID=UPI0011A3A1F6|nr:thioredoxin family protein [Flavobacterium tiangeerense]